MANARVCVINCMPGGSFVWAAYLLGRPICYLGGWPKNRPADRKQRQHRHQQPRLAIDLLVFSSFSLSLEKQPASHLEEEAEAEFQRLLNSRGPKVRELARSLARSP